MTGNNQLLTALVTGATGFVGSHLTRRLVRDGWAVHVVVRPDSNLDRLKEAVGQVVVHSHDGDTQGMLDIVRKSRPDVVFHLASLFISEHHPRDIEPLVLSNLLFGTQLLEAMKDAGVTRLVNTGTSWQHYLNEDYNPVNLYAATKQAFEDILRFYVEVSGLRAITLRLFDTYGPDDPRPKLMNLLQKVADNQASLDMSAGDQLVDLVFIDDVIEAFVCAAMRLQAEMAGDMEAYGVSSGEPLKLKRIVQLFEETTGKELPIAWGRRDYRSREVMFPWERGATLPGWRPNVSLLDGLEKLLRKKNI